MKSKNRLHSFRYAFQGIFQILMREPNARIHLAISFLVVILGFYFRISVSEWLFLLLAMCMVFCAEIFNTAIEYLCDRITLEQDEMIRNVKDLAAAAVLVAALFAVITGVLVFWPYIF
ncbi:diacylglycerol kinase [Fulvivirga sedimenti]|uniref:Diacylglycerol kinase family protein n=1 Tax=Fulvivirga sedimenti TaxID=2879465 RepID=A0A9X1KUM5_9BACT|nr:diacylglycerol kinase family protein [Fulvivirga sedimenti]MCA6073668.1 diacylglycerol kinase family protein [Fulvivirga sedimenti]